MSDFSKFKHEPVINVISKDAMEERIYKVFKILWETLSKSFGPYGAPTVICYPSRHVTKDGFTIMKNLAFMQGETRVDQTIADMAYEICSRLNYKVGDGTTSAIIATFSIYQAYMQQKKALQDDYVMPRDIMERYSVLLEKIISKLDSKATQIDKSTPESLYNAIKDVVMISSNGDEEITEIVANMYKELGTPGINVRKSPDGITRSEIVEGYRFQLGLSDRRYINNDNNTMDMDCTDVLIFGTTVTESVYTKIINPLNEECRFRRRHLMVCAPSYDETMLRNIVAPQLNREFNETKRCNLVLTTYRAFNEKLIKASNDFAVLMGTEVLSKARTNEIINKVTSGVKLTNIINIDGRRIDGTVTCVKDAEGKFVPNYIYGNKDDQREVFPMLEDDEYDESSVRLGFTRKCSIGMKFSQFTDLVYNQQHYEAILKEAKSILDEKISKYEKMGHLNTEITEAQERYYSLRLKTGVIEVGGDSELTHTFTRDVVDDCIKAAESAYRHGIIKGCNIDLIHSINEVLEESTNELDKDLLYILQEGFVTVYNTVLHNAYGDLTVSREALPDLIKSKFNISQEILDKPELSVVIASATDEDGNVKIVDFIRELSISIDETFDVSRGGFNDKVINSSQTDKEILIATIDLMKILITGNQMVVNVHHEFEYE